MAHADLKEALERVWARGWDPPEIAFHRKEFHRLVRACARLYPGMTSGKTSTPYQEAVENIFLNTPSRWTGNIEQQPEGAAEDIDRAFIQNEWPVTYWVPLDGAPKLPRLAFGPCELGRFPSAEFSQRVLGLRMRIIDERKAAPIEKNVERLSEFQWLVVHGSRRIEDMTARILGGKAGLIDGLPYFPAGSWDWGNVSPHSHGYPADVERALFALALYQWEDVVHSGIVGSWEPFQTPWIYEISDDPLARRDFPPSADTLTWDPRLIGPPENEEVVLEPRTAQLVENSFEDFPRRIRELSALMQSICGPAVTPPAGFNQVAVHLLLKAFQEYDFDQLISHCMAIDAMLGMKEHGATEKTGQRAATLTHDTQTEKLFEDLYNLRSDYLHGRKVRQDVRYDDLRSTRKLTRCIAEAWLRKLASFPHQSRDQFLVYLSSQ